MENQAVAIHVNDKIHMKNVYVEVETLRFLNRETNVRGEEIEVNDTELRKYFSTRIVCVKHE